ncbi:MAG TPA: tetraacyldisaccharide 4'-kinase, partial [Ignavibacteria bacterium]
DDIKVVELGYNNQRHPLTTENFGDEAFLFLENLKNKNGRGLIIVGDDKTKAAKFAHAKFKPEVIIIDDGFQHRKLARDLDIVILDGNEGRYMIPGGKLREPLKNKIRADVVVINEKFRETKILQNFGHQTAVICNYVLENFVNINNDDASLSGKKIVAFCGIGDPDSFIKMMANNGINSAKLIIFKDHHNYSLGDLTKIISAFENEKAGALLTTQKDFVRLKNSEFVMETKSDNLYKQLLYNYPLYYAKIKMQITRNHEALFSHLDKVANLV